MNVNDLIILRLYSQHISRFIVNTPGSLVHYMGALQAQDYLMAKWAVGIRLPGITDVQVQAAIDNGEIIRTHVMRPTWHFVAPSDVYWMLDLTAPNIQRLAKGRYKQLELTHEVLKKALNTITKCLSNIENATRAELLHAMAEKKIATDENRASHILMEAELAQLICSGSYRDGVQTYTLLSERIKTPNRLPREEALPTLAMRYFTSHGPATIKDFIWWSGLSATDAKAGVEAVKTDLQAATIGGEIYLFANDITTTTTGKKDTLHLLPGYDEYIISYRDRSAALQEVHTKHAISNNGIFRPVIIKDGEVIGLWKTVRTPGHITVATVYFKEPNSGVKKLVQQKIADFAAFTGNKLKEKQNA